MDDVEKQIESVPKRPGVYLMKDESENLLYVGKAKCLRTRVSSYFRDSADHPPKIAKMVRQVAKIDFRETDSEIEALILESRLIKQLQPKYNSRKKDGKTYPFLAIDTHGPPRIFIAREHECVPPERYRLYGPFVDASGLKSSFKILQRVFRFRTCTLDLSDPKRRYRPCLLASIGYCSGICAGMIGRDAYLKSVDSLERFLNGERKDLIVRLQEEMKQCASKWEFEKAAQLRDQSAALENLDRINTLGDFVPGQFFNLDAQGGLKMLGEILEMEEVPQIIEGVDIAHYAGNEAVGSLVSFVDGFPNKPGYRRYRIRGIHTDNDYAMIQEVLQRRFCGQDKDREHPDILLIDGGKGQLRSALKMLRRIGMATQMVVSLAKRQEEVYIPGKREPIALPIHSPVHHLLCYVRDEAHRFAQHYHTHLRSQRIRRKNRDE